jgi:hypothetical protein
MRRNPAILALGGRPSGEFRLDRLADQVGGTSRMITLNIADERQRCLVLDASGPLDRLLADGDYGY